VAVAGSGVGASNSINTGDGVMFSRSSIRFADILDGLSNTACFGEQTLGAGGSPSSPTGGPPGKPEGEVLELSGATPTTPAACVVGAGGSNWSGLRGAKWMNGHYGDTLYNHFLPPNSKQFDCGNASHNFGLTAARSRHVGGVSENVAIMIWQGIATRFGGEAVGEF
jgi:hypothetical protein